ncbi:unnamed protein product [Calypogeia fissa]
MVMRKEECRGGRCTGGGESKGGETKGGRGTAVVFVGAVRIEGIVGWLLSAGCETGEVWDSLQGEVWDSSSSSLHPPITTPTARRVFALLSLSPSDCKAL